MPEMSIDTLIRYRMELDEQSRQRVVNDVEKTGKDLEKTVAGRGRHREVKSEAEDYKTFLLSG
jgi:hypothetical protein